MNNYIIADSPVPSYNKVICLLDYRVGITTYLENINNSIVFNNRVIVDTLLVSGSTPYRFVSLDINKDGRLDLSSYKYVDLDDDMVHEFNKLIKDEVNWVRNSILAPKQKDKLLSLR